MASFLICTKPAHGHVNPVLPIARELVARGHRVAWYTGTAFGEAVAAVGARHVPVRRAPDFYGRDTVAGYRASIDPHANKLRGLSAIKFDVRHLCYDVAAKEFDDVSELVDSTTIDVVLSDNVTLGALYACERLRVPCAVLAVSVMGFGGPDVPPMGLGLRPLSGPMGRLRNSLLSRVMNAVLLGEATRYGDRVRSALDLPPARRWFFDWVIDSCDLWLQATAPEFEYPRRELPSKVRFIGPLLPLVPPSFAPPAWWSDLDRARPVVLVTQGTVRSDPNEFIAPTLAALAEEDVLVVVTTGGSEMSAPVPANARVEPFISYHHLLPRLGVMVTNAGYGGVQMALRYAVPLVCAGRTEDKADICAHVAWSGAGIDLRTHTPRPGRIRRAVQEVLANPRYAERARFIGRALERYDAPRTAADLLEGLARGDTAASAREGARSSG